jgi:hypothetical protein
MFVVIDMVVFMFGDKGKTKIALVMIDRATAGYTPDNRIFAMQVVEVHLTVDALIFTYHHAWRVDIQHDEGIMAWLHMADHMLLYGSIDVGVAIISVVDKYHRVNIRDLACKTEIVNMDFFILKRSRFFTSSK